MDDYTFSPRNQVQFGYRLQEVSKDFIGGGTISGLFRAQRLYANADTGTVCVHTITSIGRFRLFPQFLNLMLQVPFS